MSDHDSDTHDGQTAETTRTPKPAPNWLSRVLWMGPRVAEAREKTFGPGKPGYDWYFVGRQLRDNVLKIGEIRKGEWATLLLDCAAVGYLVRAHLAREGLWSVDRHLAREDWENARRLAVFAEAWNQIPPEQGPTLTALLGPDRDLAMAKLSGEEREALTFSLRDLVNRLAKPLDIEANRLVFVLLTRWTRVAAAVLVLVAILGFGGSWVISKIAKPNLAFHRSVSVSSQYESLGSEPGRLVDGDTGNMGFHTYSGGQQWVVIDLGSVRKFDKVVVYNRPELQERAVPLRMEVSRDGQTYTPLAERKETFKKWISKGLHAEGRYLRLMNTPPNYFHMSEVEVY
jgi:hypothetical protein